MFRIKVQLELEEMIADIKRSNDIDVNFDETKLEPDLFNRVQNIFEQSSLKLPRNY